MKAVTSRISLGFLGEGHEDSFLILTSVAMKDYERVVGEAKALKGDDSKSNTWVAALISDRFQSGNIAGEAITKEDLMDLPASVFSHCYAAIMGADVSPKG